MDPQAQDAVATGSKRKRGGSGEATGRKRKRTESGEAAEGTQAEDLPAKKKKSRASKAKQAEQTDARTTIVPPAKAVAKVRASNARKGKSATRNGQ